MVEDIFNILKKTYPKVHVALINWNTPWELLVAVQLSAQCTDVRVNIVTAKLFAKYKTLEAYIHADPKEFERDIKSTGFYHNKAKNILAAARAVKEKFDGMVPKTMAQMLTIPGVARKTANVVLGSAYGIVEGIAVDTHVLRLSQRLRLVNLDTIGGGKKIFTFVKNGKTIVDFKKDADPVKIEQELMAVVPKNDWMAMTHMLVAHGRAVCKAQKPNCAACVLNKYCPSSRV